MEEKNAIDLHNKRENLYWRGVDHSMTTIKMDLNYLLEITTDEINSAIFEPQLEHDGVRRNMSVQKKKEFMA